MDRKAFLKMICGVGVCGCVTDTLDLPAVLEARDDQAADGRLFFARVQVANMARLMEASPSSAACAGVLEGTGRACAKIGGLAARFKGNPDGYFGEASRAWGTRFDWDKVNGVVTVTVAEGPCGCPLVDARRTPAFWCNCSVGYQKESLSTVFERPVEASLKASKLSGAATCVFEVRVGTRA